MEFREVVLKRRSVRKFDPNKKLDSKTVRDCLELTPSKVAKYRWLPKTCAYRLLSAGKALCWWHPLVSGDVETVHRAGVSVRNRVISEEYVHPDDIQDYIVQNLPGVF